MIIILNRKFIHFKVSYRIKSIILFLILFFIFFGNCYAQEDNDAENTINKSIDDIEELLSKTHNEENENIVDDSIFNINRLLPKLELNIVSLVFSKSNVLKKVKDKIYDLKRLVIEYHRNPQSKLYQKLGNTIIYLDEEVTERLLAQKHVQIDISKKILKSNIHETDKIVRIDAIDNRSDFISGGTIYLDSEFQGYTPTDIIVKEGEHLLVIEYVFRSFENRYEILLNVNSDKISAVLHSDYHSLVSDNCVVRNKADLDVLEKWENSMEHNVEEGKNTKITIKIPGLIRVESSCPFSPWFGETRYYRLDITSDPDGADIIIEKKIYGKTPQVLMVKHDFARNRMNELHIFVKKQGYVGKTLTHIAKSNFVESQLHFKLAKLKQ